MADEDKLEQPIVIKKIKKGGGHHGGAWKVAYADFVTAMMAFFLLLWLLNVSTDEERNAISNFFDPTHPTVSQRESGAGGVMGGLSMSTEGAMTTNQQAISNPTPTGMAGKDPKSVQNRNLKGGATQEGVSELEKAKEKLRQQETERFKEAEKSLREAIDNNPDLKNIKDNILIDQTPEGLRIQVIDKDGNPMFATGSAQMFEKTEKLFRQVAAIIKEQPNDLSIRGHTDSAPYGPGATYTNWELSADRANSSRRVLLDAEFPKERINNVVGKADKEHLIPDDPRAASNRRVSIILLREELTNPDFAEKAKALIPESSTPIDPAPPVKIEEGDNTGAPGIPKLGTFKQTPGKVEFP